MHDGLEEFVTPADHFQDLISEKDSCALIAGMKLEKCDGLKALQSWSVML
jgi:hypothetical protein